MRVLPIVAAATLTAALAACASPGPRETFQQEYERLNAACQARGGILVPQSQTGQISTDYFCEIRGPGARLSDD
ncbi:MAG: hypothetical protein V7678_06155 [Brevundimonas sp.]